MTKSLKNLSLIAGLALVASTGSAYSELDAPSSKAVPASVIVRVNNKTGQKEQFISDSTTKVTNNVEAAIAANQIKKSNKIKLVNYSELDSGTAKKAWGCYRYPTYSYYPYAYSYYYYGYYYNYVPYYTYTYSNYSYYYCWPSW